MSRLGAIVSVALGAISLGCGGEEPARADGPEAAPTDSVDTPATGGATEEPIDPDWALDLAILGRTALVTARAELKVVQGESRVHLAITGRTSDADYVMIDLTFESIEEAMGPHVVEFSLPEGGEHVAISSLDDTWYYSQGGQIEVSASPDGHIAGSFEIALTLAEPVEPSDGPVALAPSDVAPPLQGSFSGDWVLNCHSRLDGHMALVFGGRFCDDLVIGE